jgi:hypothetical protein
LGVAELEKIAAEVLAEAGMGAPVCAYRLCLAAGLEVRVGRRGTRPTVIGRTVIVQDGDPPERQRFAAAHELAHLLLRDRGVPDDEWSVNWLASALLLPRSWFLQRIEERGWDLAALREDCPHSSYEAIGRRVVNLGRAVLWICDKSDAGNSQRRWLSRGVPAALERPTPREWEMVGRVGRSKVAESTTSLGAWPLEARGVLRVISLGKADELAQLTR